MTDDPASPGELRTASRVLNVCIAVGVIASVGLRIADKISTGDLLLALLLCVGLYGGATTMGWIAVRAAREDRQ